MREPRGLLSQNHLQVGGLETHPSLSLHRVALVLSSRFTSSFGEDAGTSPEEFEAYRTGPKLAVTRCLCLRRLVFQGQQCWREYYQWCGLLHGAVRATYFLAIAVRCKIWQKYYDQSKGKAKAWNSESDSTVGRAYREESCRVVVRARGILWPPTRTPLSFSKYRAPVAHMPE